MPDNKTTLDATAVASFAAALADLPHEEIRKAKRLYILNAIADQKAYRSSATAVFIVLAVLCIIPLFLAVLIPAFVSYRITIGAQRRKILNAIEVWADDLGPDAPDLAARV